VWVTASDSSGPTTPSPSDSTTQKHSNIVFSAAMIVPAANGHQNYILNSQNLPDVQAQETSFSTTDAVRCMLGSLPIAVQSLCHQGEKLRRRGEPIEDQHGRAISKINDPVQIRIAQL
jgi:hypothetical protein